MKGKSPAAEENAASSESSQDLEFQRQELANLIGRLLARKWLRAKFEKTRESKDTAREAKVSANGD